MLPRLLSATANSGSRLIAWSRSSCARMKSADAVADRHSDRDLRAGNFRRRRRQRRRALHQLQRRLVEQARTRAAHDARVMHAAAAIDAEGELRYALLTARLGR